MKKNYNPYATRRQYNHREERLENIVTVLEYIALAFGIVIALFFGNYVVCRACGIGDTVLALIGLVSPFIVAITYLLWKYED